MRSHRNHLVFFVKVPQLGRVKTRLARDIGQTSALNFYRSTLIQLIRLLARDARWKTSLAISPDIRKKRKNIWPKTLAVISQGNGCLGDRMERALRAFPSGNTIIIGADIPDLTIDLISTAFQKLRSADFVFGPALDGGYWLVGINSRLKGAKIFSNVRWSTSYALEDTIANIPFSKKIAYAGTLADIDDGRSFNAWRARVSR